MVEVAETDPLWEQHVKAGDEAESFGYLGHQRNGTVPIRGTLVGQTGSEPQTAHLALWSDDRLDKDQGCWTPAEPIVLLDHLESIPVSEIPVLITALLELEQAATSDAAGIAALPAVERRHRSDRRAPRPHRSTSTSRG